MNKYSLVLPLYDNTAFPLTIPCFNVHALIVFLPLEIETIK